jgi:hypothetical protein
MKLKHFITASVAGLACLGTLLSSSASADQRTTQTKSELQRKSAALKAKLSKKYTFLDVQLGTNGDLAGTVFNKKREAVADALVIVRQAGKEIERTRSDKFGDFQIKQLKPGNYHIIAGTGHGLFRVWTAKAAPPKAFKTVKIMSDKSVIRGQDDIIVDRETGETYGQVRIYDGGGLVPVQGGEPIGFFNGGGSGLGALGVWDILTGAATFTALGVAIKNSSDVNDLEDRLNRQQQTAN